MQGGSVPIANPKPAISVASSERIPVMPSEGAADGEIDLVAVGLLLWARRYLVLALMVLCAAAAAYYAFTKPTTFRADVVVTEVSEGGLNAAAALASQLTGLVNIPSLGFGAGRGQKEAEPVLESRLLVQEYISRNNLVAQLYPNSKKRQTLWRAVQEFQKGILSIRQDPRRGVTTVSVEWTDPTTAARWANGIVALANELIRTRALEEAKRNIEYLNAQIEHTNDVELRRAIYNLIESETKTLMLANGRPEYAFRIVDPAVPPEVKAGPHRALILLTGLAVGALFGGLIVLASDWVSRQRRRLHREP